ncbi:MAG: TIGR03435 family protein [Candidatus Solibacter sp.]
MKTFLLSLIAIAATNVAAAQNQPKFEVASVKRAERCFTGASSIDPGSVTLKALPLKAVLMEAFKIKMDQIEGPSWLETECFDISAKVPEGVAKDQLPVMLQALLAERFKLVAHKVDRPRTGFALVIDKGGPKFKEEDPEAPFMGKDARPGLMFFGRNAVKGVMTMASLASNLSRQGFGPVQDATGLTGKYGIDLKWASDKPLEAADSDPSAPEASIFTAVRESLGLKLEPHTVPVQYLVIDRIERVPTEN